MGSASLLLPIENRLIPLALSLLEKRKRILHVSFLVMLIRSVVGCPALLGDLELSIS